MKDCATSTLSTALDLAHQDGLLPVLLVRHGRTADNAARVFVGRRDVSLDEVGQDQARHLRAALSALRPQAVIASPLRRAQQTVEGLGTVRTEPRLMEVHHGAIEGLQEQEFRTRFAQFLERWTADPEHNRIPGGESLGQAAARSWPALCSIAEDAVGSEPVVICSHQLVIATLLCRCQGLPLARYRDFTCRNTAINVLGWRTGAWRVLLTDDISHLEG